MMRLPIQGLKARLTDNSIHVPGFTAGGAGGFFVWSPRPPARPPIALSANVYYEQTYSLAARSGCPIDWVHRRYFQFIRMLYWELVYPQTHPDHMHRCYAAMDLAMKLLSIYAIFDA